MLIEWKEEYSVGVQKIDEQHQTLISIMNKIAEFIGKRRDFQEVGALIDYLLSYAREHFDLEEKYFDEFNFEFKDYHKNKHNEFIKTVGDIKEKYKINLMEASFDLIDYLEDWFIDHITNEDQKYVELFKSHGLS